MCLSLGVMRRKLRIGAIAAGCWLLAALPGSIRAQQNTVTLQLLARAGQQALTTEDSCTNAAGETFAVRNFRYYLSHIQLAGADGRYYEAAETAAYLADMRDSSSQQIMLTTKGPVQSIRFLLGVDSMANVTGVHTGTLDPAKGMFWTWNSGYIMAKLEGRSPQSTAPGRNFTYHIGGYKTGQQTARWITLPVTATPANRLVLAADILQWFGGSAGVTIASHPVCHEPGPLAVAIADNYTRMFSVVKEGEQQP